MSAPRTVALYTDSDAFGGVEMVMLTLLRGLDRDRWRPVLIHHGAPGLEPLLVGARAAGVDDLAVPALPEGLAGLRAAPALGRCLRRLRPAVLHAHLSWPFAAKWALLTARSVGVPAVVATAHLWVECPVGVSRRAQVAVLGRAVDALVAVSEATAERFRALGWPAHRVRVVHNGIPLGDVLPPPAADEGPAVVTVARLDAQKGHAVLLDALARLPGVRAVLVGDGPLRADLERAVVTHGLADRVTFTGFRQDVRELLGGCDAVVLPSLYEGLPLSLIEAMAAGRPVVATRVGGVPELIRDGRDGLLVPPGDAGALAQAMRALLDDPAGARTRAASARRRVQEHFSREAMLAGYEDVYARAGAR